MKFIKKTITYIVLITFLFSNVISNAGVLNDHDPEILSANTLSPASVFSDLRGIQFKDISNIKIALHAQLRKTFRDLTPETLAQMDPQQLKNFFSDTIEMSDRSVYSPQKMQFFFSEMLVFENGFYSLRCRIRDQLSDEPRTYRIIFSKNAVSSLNTRTREHVLDFPLEVFSDDEYNAAYIADRIRSTGNIPFRTGKDNEAVERKIQHEEGIDAVLRYAHAEGLAKPTRSSIFNFKKTVQQLKTGMNLEITTPENLKPIEDRNFFIVKITPEIRKMIDESPKAKIVDEDGKELEVNYYATSSNNAVHVFVEEHDFNYLTGASVPISKTMADAAKARLIGHIVHEIGAMTGMPVHAHMNIVPDKYVMNDIDDRYMILLRQNKTPEEALKISAVDLDVTMPERDYSAGTTYAPYRSDAFKAVLHIVNKLTYDEIKWLMDVFETYRTPSEWSQAPLEIKNDPRITKYSEVLSLVASRNDLHNLLPEKDHIGGIETLITSLERKSRLDRIDALVKVAVASNSSSFTKNNAIEELAQFGLLPIIPLYSKWYSTSRVSAEHINAEETLVELIGRNLYPNSFKVQRDAIAKAILIATKPHAMLSDTQRAVEILKIQGWPFVQKSASLRLIFSSILFTPSDIALVPAYLSQLDSVLRKELHRSGRRTSKARQGSETVDEDDSDLPFQSHKTEYEVIKAISDGLTLSDIEWLVKIFERYDTQAKWFEANLMIKEDYRIRKLNNILSEHITDHRNLFRHLPAVNSIGGLRTLKRALNLKTTKERVITLIGRALNPRATAASKERAANELISYGTRALIPLYRTLFSSEPGTPINAAAEKLIIKTIGETFSPRFSGQLDVIGAAILGATQKYASESDITTSAILLKHYGLGLAEHITQLRLHFEADSDNKHSSDIRMVPVRLMKLEDAFRKLFPNPRRGTARQGETADATPNNTPLSALVKTLSILFDQDKKSVKKQLEYLRNYADKNWRNAHFSDQDSHLNAVLLEIMKETGYLSADPNALTDDHIKGIIEILERVNRNISASRRRFALLRIALDPNSETSEVTAAIADLKEFDLLPLSYLYTVYYNREFLSLVDEDYLMDTLSELLGNIFKDVSLRDKKKIGISVLFATDPEAAEADIDDSAQNLKEYGQEGLRYIRSIAGYLEENLFPVSGNAKHHMACQKFRMLIAEIERLLSEDDRKGTSRQGDQNMPAQRSSRQVDKFAFPITSGKLNDIMEYEGSLDFAIHADDPSDLLEPNALSKTFGTTGGILAAIRVATEESVPEHFRIKAREKLTGYGEQSLIALIQYYNWHSEQDELFNKYIIETFAYIMASLLPHTDYDTSLKIAADMLESIDVLGTPYPMDILIADFLIPNVDADFVNLLKNIKRSFTRRNDQNSKVIRARLGQIINGLTTHFNMNDGATTQNQGGPLSKAAAVRHLSEMRNASVFYKNGQNQIAIHNAFNAVVNKIRELTAEIDKRYGDKSLSTDLSDIGVIPSDSPDYTLVVTIDLDGKKRTIGIYQPFIEGIAFLKSLIVDSNGLSYEQEDLINTLIEGSVLHEFGHGFEGYSNLDLYSLVDDPEAMHFYKEYAELAGYTVDNMDDRGERKRFAEAIADLSMAGRGGKDYAKYKSAYLFYYFIRSHPDIYIGNPSALRQAVVRYFELNSHFKKGLVMSMAEPDLDKAVSEIADRTVENYKLFFGKGTKGYNDMIEGKPFRTGSLDQPLNNVSVTLAERTDIENLIKTVLSNDNSKPVTLQARKELDHYGLKTLEVLSPMIEDENNGQRIRNLRYIETHVRHHLEHVRTETTSRQGSEDAAFPNKPDPLFAHETSPYFIGMSMGGTKLYIALYKKDITGKPEMLDSETILWSDIFGLAKPEDIADPNIVDPESIVEKAVNRISGLLRANNVSVKQLNNIGCTSPGPISDDHRVIGDQFKTFNLPFTNFKFAERIETGLRAARAQVKHDAESGLEGELSLGQLRDVSNGLYIIQGTGLGGSVAYNGKYFTDIPELTEPGHHIVGTPDPREPFQYTYRFIQKYGKSHPYEVVENPDPLKSHQITESEARDIMKTQGLEENDLIWKTRGETDIEEVVAGLGIQALLDDKSKLMELLSCTRSQADDFNTPKDISILVNQGSVHQKEMAAHLIYLIGNELGKGLATLINESFSKKWQLEKIVIGSSVGEKLGIDNSGKMYSTEDGKDAYYDIIRRSVRRELTKKYGLPAQYVDKISENIFRSDITQDERETAGFGLKENDIAGEIVYSASKTGLKIPTAPGERYTLLVDHSLYRSSDELDADIEGYTLPDGTHIGARDRFNIISVDTSNVDNILSHIKDASKTILQISNNRLTAEQLMKLTAVKQGIRIVKVDTTNFKYAKDMNDEVRRNYRFDMYAMMLAARSVTENDIKMNNSVFRVLSFYINTRFRDSSENIAESYVHALLNTDIAFIIQHNLSYKPVSRWEVPNYKKVTVALISA